MFVKKNKNRSGTTSVQIIDKSGGKYTRVKTIGVSDNPIVIEELCRQGQAFIHNLQLKQQPQLLELRSPDSMKIESFLQSLSNLNVRTVGPELIFGTIFDRIGFDSVPDSLFRHLVVSRLVFPVSKVKTVDYLRRYTGQEISVDRIYRFLDTLQSDYKEIVERISYQYTKNTLGSVSVVFYDMTTLYFEAEDEDDLRKVGFSKDGKFQKPQIMIGLLVGQHGYPIGYDIFEGNTFEGHTLMPFLEKMQRKHGFNQPIVIADSALLSKDNLNRLSEENYNFILGARIKNESSKLKEKILNVSTNLHHGENVSIQRHDGTRLVVTYSDKRAKKDKYNREKGLRKLREKIRSGRLTKSNVNNRGYNKFLRMKGDVRISIDEQKIEEDKLWDGLKGYVTNTRLWGKTIVGNYSHLWQIEQAFRISKTDLRIRPVHHYRKRRIEAHICISFVAYTIYKELERLLKKNHVNMSVKRAAEITKNMYELEYTLPDEITTSTVLCQMDEEQLELFQIVNPSLG